MMTLTPALTAYLLFLTALLGLVMGSFLNCLAWRLAHGESVLRGRSHCAVCGHTLGWADLVPLFSWLFLRGKCRYCGEKVSPRYPAAELVCGLIYVSVILRYDFTLDALRFLLLLSILLAASLVDLEIGELPDGLTAAALAGWAVLALPDPDRWALLLRGLAGALALFLPMLGLVLLLDKLLGRETMGGGDLKLLFVLGAYFGWQQGLLLLILACVLGLGLAALLGKAKPDTPFPFGPALSAAAWLTALFGQWALDWYLGLFL